MDEDTLRIQCKDVGQCIAGLKAALLKEANPQSGASKIVVEVLKLIKSFKALGEYYGIQLVTKCTELETEKAEKKQLQQELHLVRHSAPPAASAPGLCKEANGQSAAVLDCRGGDEGSDPAEKAYRLGSLCEGCQGLVVGAKNENKELQLQEKIAKRDEELLLLRKVCENYEKEVVESRTQAERANEALKKVKLSNEINIDLLKTQAEQLTGSMRELTGLQEELQESRKEAIRATEQLAKVTSSNDSFSWMVKKEAKQTDDLKRKYNHLKACLQLMASKNPSPATQVDDELLQVELRGLECRGLDAEVTSYLKTILERSMKSSKCSAESQTQLTHVSRVTQTLVESPTPLQSLKSAVVLDSEISYPQGTPLVDSAQDGEMVIQNTHEHGTEEVDLRNRPGEDENTSLQRDGRSGRLKRHQPIQFIDLDSDSEDDCKKNHDYFPQYKVRKVMDRQGLNSLDPKFPASDSPSADVSMKMREVSGIMQQRLLQEQTMVENLCKMMEDYQHKFLEKPCGVGNYGSIGTSEMTIQSSLGMERAQQQGLGVIGRWLECTLGVSVSIMEDAIRGCLRNRQEIWNRVMAHATDGLLEVSTFETSHYLPKDWKPCIRYCLAVCCGKARLTVKGSVVIVQLAVNPERKERRAAFFREIVFAKTLEVAKSHATIALHEEGFLSKKSPEGSHSDASLNQAVGLRRVTGQNPVGSFLSLSRQSQVLTAL